MKGLRFRIIFILIVLVVSLAVDIVKPVTLGLDLRGGTHLVLQIDSDKAFQDEALSDLRQIEQLLESENIPIVSAKSSGKSVIIVPLESSSISRIVSLIKDEYKDTFDVKTDGKEVILSFKKNYLSKELGRLGQQALETIRNRIDQLGVAEPLIVKSGKDRIIVELPGIKDPKRAKKVIGKVAKLEFKEVVGVAGSKQALLDSYGNVTDNEEVLPQDIKDKSGRVIGHRYFLLKRNPILTGAYLKNAYPSTDEYGMPAVSFELNSQGAGIFTNYTSKHIGTRLAIVLDNKVQSAPVIRSAIGSKGQITGQFTFEEAKDLAIVLRAGALPAPVKIIEETTIGPSLGRQSIKKGIVSGTVGLIIVMVFMMLYYKMSGLIADIALLMNAILMWAALVLLGATLTLPGIAGFVLTIGMAVDANVIIFERIREELSNGRTVLSSIEAGFERAWGTIIDSNVTTLVAALVLFQFGTGPIKGFAVTLSLGIICSMFTAVFVTKVLLDALVRFKTSLFSV